MSSLAGEDMAGVEGPAPTKNQALAGIRHLSTRSCSAMPPLTSFASVRGIGYSVTESKTAEISTSIRANP